MVTTKRKASKVKRCTKDEGEAVLSFQGYWEDEEKKAIQYCFTFPRTAAKVYSEKARCLLDYDEASVETKLVPNQYGPPHRCLACNYAHLVGVCPRKLATLSIANFAASRTSARGAIAKESDRAKGPVEVLETTGKEERSGWKHDEIKGLKQPH
ncbi:hypothetical protein SLS57_004960 [Botryosphaeria dothidea]